MGYYIELVDQDSGETLQLDQPHHMKGSIYCIGGSCEASLSVTYNYGQFYLDAFGNEEGIRTIYGLTGAESIPVLKQAIANMGDEKPTGKYWEGNRGDAKRPLRQLLALAQMRPDGLWQGD